MTPACKLCYWSDHLNGGLWCLYFGRYALGPSGEFVYEPGTNEGEEL